MSAGSRAEVKMVLDCPGSRTGCSILSHPVREGLGDRKTLDQRSSRIAVAATACQAPFHAERWGHFSGGWPGANGIRVTPNALVPLTLP